MPLDSPLNVKHQRHAQKIAAALNKVKEGTGDYYMSGHYVRKLIETAAVKAVGATLEGN